MLRRHKMPKCCAYLVHESPVCFQLLLASPKLAEALNRPYLNYLAYLIPCDDLGGPLNHDALATARQWCVGCWVRCPRDLRQRVYFHM